MSDTTVSRCFRAIRNWLIPVASKGLDAAAVIVELDVRRNAALDLELLDSLLEIQLEGIGLVETRARLEEATGTPISKLPALDVFLTSYFLKANPAIRDHPLHVGFEIMEARVSMMDLISRLEKRRPAFSGPDDPWQRIDELLSEYTASLISDANWTEQGVGYPRLAVPGSPAVLACYRWLKRLDELVAPERRAELLRVLEALLRRHHTPSEAEARWATLPFAGEEGLAPVRGLLTYYFSREVPTGRQFSDAFHWANSRGVLSGTAEARQCLRRLVAELRKRCPPEVVGSIGPAGGGAELAAVAQQEEKGTFDRMQSEGRRHA